MNANGCCFELSTVSKNPVNCGSEFVSSTGIKIRTRQPQQPPASYNFVSQGTAPRRVRMKMKLANALPVSNGKEKGVSHIREEDEVQSAFTEVRIGRSR